MAKAAHPTVYSMPAHRAFSDALAVGLLRRFGKDPLAFARGIIVVPNNRARQALINGFVRQSGDGLLLPRIVAIGDPDLGEKVGNALGSIGTADALPPVIDPMHRLFALSRLISDTFDRRGTKLDAGEALALAKDLARTLDQLQVEQIVPARLKDMEQEADLPDHWQQSLDLLRDLLEQWPGLLSDIGAIDLAEYRNRLLSGLAKRWTAGSDASFVVAAGIDSAAPAIAAILRTIAFMPDGMVVLANCDLSMPDAEWDALDGVEDESGKKTQPHYTHPQYHLKLLLDRIGVARAEVKRWHAASESDASPRRSAMVSNAFAPAEFTGKWRDLDWSKRSLAGVTALTLATPAHEAQAIALAMRETLETPGQTAALVTPDRSLATRVSAHLARWGVLADDSAGRPLTQLPAGTLPLILAEAAATRFAPVELVTLLKHPLVMKGEGRREWLGHVRLLDRLLRGPRPATGLSELTAYFAADGERRTRDDRHAILPWWQSVCDDLQPLEKAFTHGADDRADFMTCIDALRDTIERLAGDEAWRGPAGRAMAQIFTDIAQYGDQAPDKVAPAAVAHILETLMADIAVRPPQGGHPRLFIWGLIEARLQSADLMILGGLNEGTWPQIPQPDPWLAPGIRRRLDVPGLDWRIGLSAHDFASALAAPKVLVTRAKRDAGAPTVASRFVLRMEAMAGDLPAPSAQNDWGGMASALDRATQREPVDRPAPEPSQEQRPDKISVTRIDTLLADPYAFYAEKILALGVLDTLDADPSAAWRGSAVHAVLEQWSLEGGHDPARLIELTHELLRSPGANPVLRTLWEPRLMDAIAWIADTMTQQIAEGRIPELFEGWGEIVIDGVMLGGKADRIDLMPDGSVAIVDYKTGQPPSPSSVRAGFGLQLGLLGLIAENGGFKDLGKGKTASVFEYWSLAKKGGKAGFIGTPFAARPEDGDPGPEDFTAFAAARADKAIGRWLSGDEPFLAKRRPDYAPYTDYDQLMRLQEWMNR